MAAARVGSTSLTCLLAGLSLVPPSWGQAPRSGTKPKAEAKQEVVPARPGERTAESAADLLRTTGSDKYGPKIDWRTIPPWRQTSFFGVRAQGKVFVYVVDCSGSMGDGDRLVRAKAEIRRSVMGLQWPQRFLVIFYNDRPLPMPGGLPKSADLKSKSHLLDWFRLIDAEGQTDPRGAMAQALGLRPDAVFLLSDGEFPEGSVEAIAEKNTGKVPVHCIDLAGGAAGDQLRRIAEDSGGEYRSRP